MGILGIFGGLFALAGTLCYLAEDGWENRVTKVSALATVIFIAMIVWDVKSPTTVEETNIITNDYGKYGINVSSDKIGHVHKTETEATRFGAIFKDSTTYEFLDFVEEK